MYPMGEQRINFHAVDDRGSALASGVYFIRVQTGSRRQTIKALLLK